LVNRYALTNRAADLARDSQQTHERDQAIQDCKEQEQPDFSRK
jgi:hypothetical protein